MELIRVITNYHRRTQRLGFLKHLAWRASQQVTSNLSSLGKELINAVSQRITVTLFPDLQRYIHTTLTDPLYIDLRAKVSKPLDDSSDRPSVQVEIQDVFLADPIIPSCRGRLVKDDWNKYPYLGVDLGLFRRGSFSLLARGQAFLSLVPEDEKKAFANSVTLVSGDGKVNPLRLTLPQRLLLLFSFVGKDGDILKRLYEKLLGLCEPFTDWEAGDYLSDIYRLVAKESRSRVRSGDDLLKIRQLLDAADKIESWKGRPYKGKGARDEAATIRLEPLVDLCLLSKPNPSAHRYEITNATKTFLESVINSEGIEYFLDNSFFDASNKAFNLNAEDQLDREMILSLVQKAYTVLKSPLGYAPILEVCLLAGIYSITETGAYFEVSDCRNAIISLQKEKAELVRFNIDRWGDLAFVKFNQ